MSGDAYLRAAAFLERRTVLRAFLTVFFAVVFLAFRTVLRTVFLAVVLFLAFVLDLALAFAFAMMFSFCLVIGFRLCNHPCDTLSIYLLPTILNIQHL